MKRKIFTLLLSVFFVTMAMAAEKPNIIIKKATVAPEIDGVVDAVWAEASKQNFSTPLRDETPTLGETGTTTWQALWTDDGIYLLLTVNDDEWYPSYVTGGNSWEYDKPEVYFDVNEIKVDGGGASGGKGHHQFAPEATAENIDGALGENKGASFAYKVSDPAYKVEYFFPFEKLVDAGGNPVDITKPIGFDVTLIDREVAGTKIQRLNWSNDGKEAYGGKVDESWNSMDGCGLITLSDADGIVMKATVAPEVDGKVDEVWATAITYNINKPFYRNNTDPGFPAFEVPTLGASTWKALWNDNGMYILLEVDDDNWFPSWAAPGTDNPSHMYDKPELYFDTNVPRIDGKGGQNNDSSNKGSIQIAPESKEGILDGSIQTFLSKPTGVDVNFAYLVTEPKYVVEYFVPWDALVDKDGKAFDKMTSMGFDVTLIDQDDGVTTTRNRAVWMNDGTGTTGNESWGNMDAAGVITFFGATPGSDVENITVTGGSITTDNGTLQMVAKVEPSDATQSVSWFVENGTGRATISSTGVLSATVNGTVMVKAVSKDGTDIEAKATVTISGQKVTVEDVSIIKNGNFDKGTNGKESWGVGSPTVVDGMLTQVTTGPPATDPQIWSTMFGQGSVKVADAETAYTLKFKAFATNDMLVPMIFEDRNNGSGKALTSLSEFRDDGYGKWDIPVTTEPTWFTIDVVFSSWVENSNYEFNFQVGLLEGTISVDSVSLVSAADMALIGTGVKSLSNANKVKLYPNPVKGNELLTVSKIATANSKVSVYNAVGQKLMEKIANGTQAKFDVSNLRKGMYFVRFSDGTSQKFIKQ